MKIRKHMLLCSIRQILVKKDGRDDNDVIVETDQLYQ